MSKKTQKKNEIDQSNKQQKQIVKTSPSGSKGKITTGATNQPTNQSNKQIIKTTPLHPTQAIKQFYNKSL